MSEKGLTLQLLAKQLGVNADFISEILNGNEEINEKLAEKLEKTLGSSKNFWINRERNYRFHLSRLPIRKNIEDHKEWFKKIPYNELVNNSWVEKSTTEEDKIYNSLKFFKCSSVFEWIKKYIQDTNLVYFKKSDAYKQNEVSIVSWLRMGEIVADEIHTQAWNKEKFINDLERIKSLTKLKDPSNFIPKLQNICAESGVAVAIIKTPKGCPVSGATKFIDDNKALLMLSFRYLSDDHFWFSFFHEAAHLILHGHKIFLELNDSSTEEEREANDYASNILVAPSLKEEMLSLPNRSRDIIRFALKANVSPGIIVGQLQHYGILGYQQQNSLKRRFRWSDSSKD